MQNEQIANAQAKAAGLTETMKRVSLVAKLAEVMAEIDHVEKKGRNAFHNYNYVKAADLANAVRQKLAAHSVVMMSDIVEVRNYETKNRKDEIMYGVDLKVKYTFFDGDSDATISFHGYGTALDSGDKASYKAQTGALKYALRNAFLVPDEKADPEADESVDKSVAEKPVKKDPPLIITATIDKVKVVEGKEGTEVWLKLREGKIVSLAITTTDPTMSKVLDAEGSRMKFQVSESGKKYSGDDAELKGSPIYTLHNVFAVPDEDLAHDLKKSIAQAAEKKAMATK